MSLAQHRAVALRHQCQALLDEFQEWQSQSNPSNEDLRKHHSQICRVTGILQRFLAGAPAGAGSLEDSERLSGCVLFAQRTWAYFRDKFALRQVEVLRDTLKCTDEFAWECYRPARQRALQAGQIREGQLKEPPLTYFSSDAAPLIKRRETVFAGEGITPADAAQFDFELKLLPIPVVGVPWSHVNHLPSAVVVAHEVGHAVYADFAVDKPIESRLEELAAVDAGRRPGWQAWRKELFADVYAILCVGPAYVLALTDYLVGPKAVVVHERVNADWTTDLTGSGKYPTRSLRIAFNLAVLEQLGLEDGGVRQAWADAYPSPTWAEFGSFHRDVEHVASALLGTPLPALGEAPICEVIRTSAEDGQAIIQKARRLTARVPITVRRKRDEEDQEPLFREWLAAATWAYRSTPEAYVKAAGAKSLGRTLIQAIPGGTRGPGMRGRGEQDALRAQQEEADEATARTLLARALAGGE